MALQRLFAVVAMVALVLTTNLQADENCQKCADKEKCASGANCQKGDVACTGACADACPVSQAMNALPKLTYQVGTESICCAETAANLAKEKELPLTYLVGKQTFSDQHAAMVALADATETFVKEYAQPKTCEVSGKTTVAGKEHCCTVMAAETAKLVEEAMAKVSLTYKVGEKTCHCPVEASTLAKQSGDQTLFVVAGEETCCDVQARIKLAHAKYNAAVQAMVAATAKVDAAAKL